MDRIGKLTKSVLVGKNLNRAAQAALVCHEAEKALEGLFDKDFLKQVKIISSRDDCLYLSTTGSVYSQEVNLREKDILDAINKLLQNKSITRIRFKSKAKEY
ncbi:MAG TPA: DciA family protein [Patescibacteria group bacterium]|nr:DciA family protein [Patescibacteria group bacterium]